MRSELETLQAQRSAILRTASEVVGRVLKEQELLLRAIARALDEAFVENPEPRPDHYASTYRLHWVHQHLQSADVRSLQEVLADLAGEFPEQPPAQEPPACRAATADGTLASNTEQGQLF